MEKARFHFYDMFSVSNKLKYLNLTTYIEIVYSQFFLNTNIDFTWKSADVQWRVCGHFSDCSVLSQLDD